MHNRVRMICAMFLTKNLLIDWRKGEQWFMQHLIDGDFAANNGGGNGVLRRAPMPHPISVFLIQSANRKNSIQTGNFLENGSPNSNIWITLKSMSHTRVNKSQSSTIQNRLSI